MCHICEGRKDLRLIAAAMTIMSSVDFDRARMVLMSQKIQVEQVRELLEEKYPDEDGGVLDLHDLLSDEDEDSNAFMAGMAMTAVVEECVNKIDAVFDAYGPFLVPPSKEHGSADAFNSFIHGMFGDSDVEGGGHDKDEEV